MTGDGAVVREIFYSEAQGCFYFTTGTGALQHALTGYDVERDHNALCARTIAQAAEIERLTRRVNQFDCCMCGSLMDSHDIGSGHSPVSMYDYHLDQAQLHAKASEARTADLLNLMQEFCDRVDRGEVRSVKTYAKFKAELIKQKG